MSSFDGLSDFRTVREEYDHRESTGVLKSDPRQIAVIEALGAGPVEMFASSGGAVTALALVVAYPKDAVTLVAHEPPLVWALPDAAARLEAIE